MVGLGTRGTKEVATGTKEAGTRGIKEVGKGEKGTENKIMDRERGKTMEEDRMPTTTETTKEKTSKINLIEKIPFL